MSDDPRPAPPVSSPAASEPADRSRPDAVPRLPVDAELPLPPAPDADVLDAIVEDLPPAPAWPPPATADRDALSRPPPVRGQDWVMWFEHPWRFPANRYLRALVNNLEMWLEAQPAQYMVPKRFGMSAILGILTALALLFGLLKRLDAPPMLYLFFGTLGLVICIAQMLNNARPRVASVVAGMVLAPLFLLVGSILWRLRYGGDEPLVAIACIAMTFIPMGALLGYLAGTLAAGVFLLMDRLEQWWTGGEAGPISQKVLPEAHEPPERKTP